jgi:hypothetical protein
MPNVVPIPSDETVLIEYEAEEAETSPYFEYWAGHVADDIVSEIL